MKKSEIRQLIREEIKDYYKWGDEFQRFAEKKLRKMKFNGWNFTVDPRSGTFEFDNKEDTYVFATPAWDGMPYIPIDVYTRDDDDKPYYSNKVSLKGYEDFDKAFKYYLKVIKKVLDKIGK